MAACEATLLRICTAETLAETPCQPIDLLKKQGTPQTTTHCSCGQVVTIQSLSRDNVPVQKAPVICSAMSLVQGPPLESLRSACPSCLGRREKSLFTAFQSGQLALSEWVPPRIHYLHGVALAVSWSLRTPNNPGDCLAGPAAQEQGSGWYRQGCVEGPRVAAS